jgi:hypothetical protein
MADEPITGRRIYPDDELGHFSMAAGDYCKSTDGQWWIRPPRGSMGVLDNHEIVEHEDGTITVSPSILLYYGTAEDQRVTWHGYLERGIWREV